MKPKYIITIIIIIIIFILNKNYIYNNLVLLILYGQYHTISTNDKNKILYSNFYKIFDRNKIQNINSNNFFDNYQINVSKNSINQYKIINMIEQYEYADNIVNDINENESAYNIIKNIIPHMNVNGKSVNIEDCVFVDLLKSNIQTFPYIHTDIEWGVFNDSDCFQVWYLYENEEDIGNMFLFDTKIVKPSTYMEYDDNSNFLIKGQNNNKLIEKVNIKDMDLKVKYLSMKKGECLIFGKNLYHMSDFRLSKYRYSINFRVIIKDSDGGIPINLSNNSNYTNSVKIRLFNNNIKIINNKIYPKMFSLF